MGLLQKAVETYDYLDKAKMVGGKCREGHEVLAPVAHATTNADIEITIDNNGNIVDARMVDKTEGKIAFPVTEQSVGRSSGPCAHPLCEKIEYLTGENQQKYTLYLEQLENWANSVYSHPALIPILTYVRKMTILKDLSQRKIRKVKSESFVRWQVVGIGEQSGACWENKSLQRSYIEWYKDTISRDETSLCMITGMDDVTAKQHLKGVIPIAGNAKLISANDNANFTFRGRFTDSSQAVTISYNASQKAHNALKWLASEQSVRMVNGGRTFLCWNPKGNKVPHVLAAFGKSSTIVPSDYRRELWKTLEGYKAELPDGNGGVVICAFDAATSGRLSLTYYNELRESDFLERLEEWDQHCCWWNWGYNEGKYIIQSPVFKQIINCAFGTQRTVNNMTKLVTDDNVMGQQTQRLLACRVDKMKFPTDIEQLLVNRASSRQSFAPGIYNTILSVTCAVINKYRYDYFMEDTNMALEEKRRDPSYQFGRLLAVFEKAEDDTYGKTEKRETNAARMQSVFRQRPLQTANLIEEQLKKAYFPRLSYGSKVYYMNLIAEIMNIIQDFPESWNRQLGDTYLLGYYLQRREFYKSKTENGTEESDK